MMALAAIAGIQPLLWGFGHEYGVHFNVDGDGGAAGGGAAGGDDKSKAAGSGKDGKAEGSAPDAAAAKKLEMSESELQARIDAAVTKKEKELAEAAKAEREKLDKEAKKKSGDVQGLYDSEIAKNRELEAKVQAATLEIKKKDVSIKLRDYVNEHAKDYSGSIKWITPAVEFDAATDEAEIDKRIKAAVDSYVADNPRSATTQGTTAPANRGKVGGGVTSPAAKTNGETTNGEAKPPRYLNAF